MYSKFKHQIEKSCFVQKWINMILKPICIIVLRDSVCLNMEFTDHDKRQDYASQEDQHGQDVFCLFFTFFRLFFTFFCLFFPFFCLSLVVTFTHSQKKAWTQKMRSEDISSPVLSLRSSHRRTATWVLRNRELWWDRTGRTGRTGTGQFWDFPHEWGYTLLFFKWFFFFKW